MKRILLKISGEAFSGVHGAIDMTAAKQVGSMIQELVIQGYEIAIVVGGGNIYRGSKLIEAGLSPADSHNMSMLSTVFNAVTLNNILTQLEIKSIILDALHVEFLEKYSSLVGKKYLQAGNIIILSSGTGCPYFSTDTSAVLRALELECEAVIKLTKVDGVYNKDPMKCTDAVFIPEISYTQFLHEDLKVFDQTGIILARDSKLPIYVSQMGNMKALISILKGEKSGTKIF